MERHRLIVRTEGLLAHAALALSAAPIREIAAALSQRLAAARRQLAGRGLRVAGIAPPPAVDAGAGNPEPGDPPRYGPRSSMLGGPVAAKSPRAHGGAGSGRRAGGARPGDPQADHAPTGDPRADTSLRHVAAAGRPRPETAAPGIPQHRLRQPMIRPLDGSTAAFGHRQASRAPEATSTPPPAPSPAAHRDEPDAGRPGGEQPAAAHEPTAGLAAARARASGGPMVRPWPGAPRPPSAPAPDRRQASDRGEHALRSTAAPPDPAVAEPASLEAAGSPARRERAATADLRAQSPGERLGAPRTPRDSAVPAVSDPPAPRPDQRRGGATATEPAPPGSPEAAGSPARRDRAATAGLRAQRPGERPGVPRTPRDSAAPAVSAPPAPRPARPDPAPTFGRSGGTSGEASPRTPKPAAVAGGSENLTHLPGDRIRQATGEASPQTPKPAAAAGTSEPARPDAIPVLEAVTLAPALRASRPGAPAAPRAPTTLPSAPAEDQPGKVSPAAVAASGTRRSSAPAARAQDAIDREPHTEDQASMRAASDEDDELDRLATRLERLLRADARRHGIEI